ncbi:MAG: efflux RND transporter permease subunit [Desulfobacteraceae bacterium]|jgi:multidrug efflux pump subunit AcrB
MNITSAAIENNRVTLVSLIVVLFAGISAYYNMPRAEDPGFIIRAAQVITYLPGASPQRVEELVSDRLEEAIQEIPELDFVQSTSKTGLSVVVVNIKQRYDQMRPIWDSLRRKMESAARDLPEGVIGPIVNDEFGDVFGIVIGLTGEGYTYAELKEVADDVRNELLLIEDAAKVEIHGAQEERIFIEYNNARLGEIGLSPFQLQQALAARNIITPGGQVYTRDEQIVLEPTGSFDTLEEIRQTIIKIPATGDLMVLQDIARVYRGTIDPPDAIVRYRGMPALAIAVNMRQGGNIIGLGEQVNAALDRLRQAYPIGVEFETVAFQPRHVDRKVKEFTGSLLQAVVIVLAVMLVFLGLRTGLVVASLIPMAMVTALLVMSFFEIGLDQMSLASLIIALGMLVDNAIVMSESIMVQASAGKPLQQAAIDSAKELRIPLLTSSLTTAAAFLPIFLAESDTGEYTAPLFKVVTITLLSSWVLSLTMTPMLCAQFLRVKPSAAGDGYDSKFYRIYQTFLLTVLKNPALTLLAAAAVFMTAIYGFRYIPNIFFPPNDKPIFFAELRLPVGTPIRKTQQVVESIEAFIQQDLTTDSRPDGMGVKDWIAFTGQGAPRYYLAYSPEPGSPEYAYLLLNASSTQIVEETLIPKLEAFIFDNFPDLKASIRLLFLGAPIDNPVEVRLSGKSLDTLFGLVDAVKSQLGRIEGTRDITDNWGHRTKKLVVSVNQARALRAGLTHQDIAVSLQTALSGIDVTEYREEEDIIPVILRSVAADRTDLGKLETLNIYAQATGRSIALKQVADLKVVWEPSKIMRRDRLKTVTVQSNLKPGANAIAISRQIGRWLDKERRKWPVGYKYALGGELESSGKANASIAAKLPFAALIILLLLIGQFNSIRRTAIVGLTIPLGLIGVVIGLLITRSYFGFMTMLGVISLAGIVVNNAIVLLDRIKIEMEQHGLPADQAIVTSARRRLRPILLTVATTIGGLLPLWLGGGPMWEPMAIAIIFGLIFATVLTLGVVPVLYALFFRVSFRDFELK